DLAVGALRAGSSAHGGGRELRTGHAAAHRRRSRRGLSRTRGCPRGAGRRARRPEAPGGPRRPRLGCSAGSRPCCEAAGGDCEPAAGALTSRPEMLDWPGRSAPLGMLGRAWARLRPPPATLALALVLAAVFVLQALWGGTDL